MCAVLYDAANSFIHQHFVEVSMSEEFLALPFEDVLELVSRDELNVKAEEQVSAIGGGDAHVEDCPVFERPSPFPCRKLYRSNASVCHLAHLEVLQVCEGDRPSFYMQKGPNLASSVAVVGKDLHLRISAIGRL